MITGRVFMTSALSGCVEHRIKEKRATASPHSAEASQSVARTRNTSARGNIGASATLPVRSAASNMRSTGGTMTELATRLTVKPLHPLFVAEVTGVDLTVPVGRED